jgi:DNA polymerase-3 subunit gamma/tau
MAYQALYRSWRPQDFRGLIGQEHIGKTLQSALAQGKIGHAYLFSGTRGTGKTSTAKILAKAVNCSALKEGQPCGQCESCLTIASGHSMDVLEIDAASNRGIEEIRELKEKINFIPVHGKYKVYIIDEVHMLTLEAFNALLKTLEEPPAHVIFILATTEAHKLPATILSRCQRFDFRRIPLSVIEEHLQRIAASMKLDMERAAAVLIAKKADGSLRDAISLLDQCIGVDQPVLTAQTVYQILGVVRQEVLCEMVSAMTENRGDTLLAQMNALVEESVEPMQILKDVMEYFRNLMMLKICGDQTELVVAAGEDRERMLAQAHSLKLEAIQRVIGRLSGAEVDVRWRGSVRFMLESLLVELMIGLQDRSQTAAAGAAFPKTSASAPVAPPDPAPRSRSASAPVAPPDPAPRSRPASAPVAPPDSVPRSRPAKDAGSPAAAFQQEWTEILERVRERKKTLHAFLTAITEREEKDGVYWLVFKGGYDFHKEQTELPENKKLLEEILTQYLDRPVQVQCRMEDEKKEQIPDPVQKAIDLLGPDMVTIKKE